MTTFTMIFKFLIYQTTSTNSIYSLNLFLQNEITNLFIAIEMLLTKLAVQGNTIASNSTKQREKKLRSPW